MIEHKKFYWMIEKYVISLIPLMFSLIISYLFFTNRSLFTLSDIYFDDYPRHIFYSYVLWYNNILHFGNIFGYYSALYSGIPMIQFYPIGMHIIINFFHFLGFPYSVATKIVIYLSFILLSYCPYWICRMYGKGKISGVISSSWLMFAINSFSYTSFRYGMLPFVISSCCAILFIALIGKKDFSLRYSQNPVNSLQDYILLFLFCATILVNYMSTIFIGLFAIFYLLYLKLKRAVVVKNYIYYFIKLTGLAILITGFWLIPTIAIQSFHINFNSESNVFTVDSTNAFLGEYFKRNYFWMIILPVVVFIFGINEFKKKDFRYIVLIMVFFLSIFTIIFFQISQIEMLQGINSHRYLFFFEIISAVFISFIIDIENLSKRIQWLWKQKKNSKINLENNKIKKIRTSIVLISVFSIVTFSSLMPGGNSENNFIGSIYSEYRSYTTNDIRAPINYSRLDANITQIIEWINIHTDNQSRILFQDSGEESQHKIGGGHNLCLLPLYTNRFYANGYLGHHWYKYAENSSFIDDSFFGTNISEITDDFFFEKADLFNIEYIITWSEHARSKVYSINSTSQNISTEQTIDNFYIFKIKNASRNFVNVPIENFIWSESKIQFNIQSNFISSPIYLKFHDFPNWKVYINTKKIQKINDNRNPDNLIMFIIPDSDLSNDYVSVEIIWEVSPVEYISSAISMISLIGIAILGIRTRFFLRKSEAIVR